MRDVGAVQTMRIRKDVATRNEYISAGGMSVRNFTRTAVDPVSRDHLVDRPDFALMVDNITRNDTLRIPNIADEDIYFEKILVVNDGYGFADRHEALVALPPDVMIIAVNRALASWKLHQPPHRKSINLYVVNNPYADCCRFLPTTHFPTCAASSRTNHDFLRRYKGRLYAYEPTPSRDFGLERRASYYVDDYRNPICAAIGLAYRFGVTRLGLYGCDESYDTPRDGMVELDNGLHTYPQHLRVHEIVDANLYWLTHQEEREVIAADLGSGPDHANALNLDSVDELVSFFS